MLHVIRNAFHLKTHCGSFSQNFGVRNISICKEIPICTSPFPCKKILLNKNRTDVTPPQKKTTFKGLSRNDIIFWLLNKPDYSPKSPFVNFWLTPSLRYVVWCHLLHLTRPDPSSSLPPLSPFIIFWLTLPSPWKMSLFASSWICKWNIKNMPTCPFKPSG